MAPEEDAPQSLPNLPNKSMQPQQLRVHVLSEVFITRFKNFILKLLWITTSIFLIVADYEEIRSVPTGGHYALMFWQADDVLGQWHKQQKTF